MLTRLYNYFFSPPRNKEDKQTENKEDEQEIIEQAFEAIKNNDSQLLSNLLDEKNLNPNARRKPNDWTLLHFAILQIKKQKNPRGFGMLDRGNVISILLNKRADVNALYTANGRQISPLHLACRDLLPSVVNILLAYGATITLEDERGKTPLDHIEDILQKDHFKDPSSKERAEDIKIALTSLQKKPSL
jgi:ankyrin repeat protein